MKTTIRREVLMILIFSGIFLCGFIAGTATEKINTDRCYDFSNREIAYLYEKLDRYNSSKLAEHSRFLQDIIYDLRFEIDQLRNIIILQNDKLSRVGPCVKIIEAGYNVSKRKYDLNRYNCENFAYDFYEATKQFGVKIKRSNNHCYNTVCLDIEPQSDMFVMNYKR